MTAFERRQIGNMGYDDIYERQEFETQGGVITAPSAAEDWRSQGITFEVTDPVATEVYTSEQLKALGMVGVTLVIPKQK